jgi:DNA mismatch repair protein MutL
MSLPHAVVEMPRSAEAAPKISATFPGYIILEAQPDHPFFAQWLRNTRRDSLILVDQKNAHARVIFEGLTKKRLSQSPAVQSLLIPKSLVLSPYEAAKVRCALPLLNGMGIHIHESGPNHFLIDALPQIFGNNDVDAFINDILQDIPSWEESPSPAQSSDLIAVKQVARSASRAAVSVHRKLSIEEAQALIGQLVLCETPAVCPFGKPTILQLSPDDLAKLFQRC